MACNIYYPSIFTPILIFFVSTPFRIVQGVISVISPRIIQHGWDDQAKSIEQRSAPSGQEVSDYNDILRQDPDMNPPMDENYLKDIYKIFHQKIMNNSDSRWIQDCFQSSSLHENIVSPTNVLA